MAYGILILLSILWISVVKSQIGPCIDASKYGCCAGTTWNFSLRRCVECQPGFLGFQCTIACPHPYYGQKCLNVCDCSEFECNPSIGCSDMTSNNISYMMTSSEYIYSSSTDFSTGFVQVLDKNKCGFTFPSYGVILIVLSLVSLLILTGFLSFILTKLHYTKTREKENTNEYQDVQRRLQSENSYERIDVPNVFTGISNVHITYERSNKMYSIELNQDPSDAVPENSAPNNPVYDDCVNIDSTSLTLNTE